MVRTYKIAVLPGDGIGREVIPEAVRVLEGVLKLIGRQSFEFVTFECGGEYYLKTGKEWADEAEEFVKTVADGVLLGAVGANAADGKAVRRPDGNLAGYSIVIGLRMDLDLYANVRPVKLYDGVTTPLAGKAPHDIDMVIVRENTEGLYTPMRGTLTRGGTDECAVDVRLITRKGSERVIRFAFEEAKRRKGAPVDGKSRVTCVDKSNLLAGCQLFRRVYDEVAAGFPDVERDYAYVDAWTQWCVRSPEKYDVVVAPNEFGDIMTDLGGAIQGGLGLAPAANIGESHGVFAPVHGSAPTHYGKKDANPIASILAGSMMMNWLGVRRKDRVCLQIGTVLERAVVEVLKKGRVRTYDLCNGSYSSVRPSSTDKVAGAILKAASEEAERM